MKNKIKIDLYSDLNFYRNSDFYNSETNFCDWFQSYINAFS